MRFPEVDSGSVYTLRLAPKIVALRTFPDILNFLAYHVLYTDTIASPIRIKEV